MKYCPVLSCSSPNHTNSRQIADKFSPTEPLTLNPKTETEQHIADTASILAGFDPAVLAPIINRDGEKFAPLVKAIARIAELSLTFESDLQQSTPIHTNSHQFTPNRG